MSITVELNYAVLDPIRSILKVHSKEKIKKTHQSMINLRRANLANPKENLLALCQSLKSPTSDLFIFNA